jgi:hypothetical protein
MIMSTQLDTDRMAHYARRIYENSLHAPDVNNLDKESVEIYARNMARRLCLDEDEIAAQVLAIRPTTTDFQQASELAGGPQTMIRKS